MQKSAGGWLLRVHVKDAPLLMVGNILGLDFLTISLKLCTRARGPGGQDPVSDSSPDVVFPLQGKQWICVMKYSPPPPSLSNNHNFIILRLVPTCCPSSNVAIFCHNCQSNVGWNIGIRSTISSISGVECVSDWCVAPPRTSDTDTELILTQDSS